MKKENFNSLCETEPWQNRPLTYKEVYGRNYNEEDELLKQCGEIRWKENNRAINLRNYTERPEDYREGRKII